MREGAHPGAEEAKEQQVVHNPSGHKPEGFSFVGVANPNLVAGGRYDCCRSCPFLVRSVDAPGRPVNRKLVKPESNNDRLRRLLQQQPRITQKDCARILTVAARRPCNLRTVQSWLAGPQTASARSCPDWALGLIKNYRARTKKK